MSFTWLVDVGQATAAFMVVFHLASCAKNLHEAAQVWALAGSMTEMDLEQLMLAAPPNLQQPLPPKAAMDRACSFSFSPNVRQQRMPAHRPSIHGLSSQVLHYHSSTRLEQGICNPTPLPMTCDVPFPHRCRKRRWLRVLQQFKAGQATCGWVSQEIWRAHQEAPWYKSLPIICGCWPHPAWVISWGMPHQMCRTHKSSKKAAAVSQIWRLAQSPTPSCVG